MISREMLEAQHVATFKQESCPERLRVRLFALVFPTQHGRTDFDRFMPCMPQLHLH